MAVVLLQRSLSLESTQSSWSFAGLHTGNGSRRLRENVSFRGGRAYKRTILRRNFSKADTETPRGRKGYGDEGRMKQGTKIACFVDPRAKCIDRSRWNATFKRPTCCLAPGTGMRNFDHVYLGTVWKQVSSPLHHNPRHCSSSSSHDPSRMFRFL